MGWDFRAIDSEIHAPRVTVLLRSAPPTFSVRNLASFGFDLVCLLFVGAIVRPNRDGDRSGDLTDAVKRGYGVDLLDKPTNGESVPGDNGRPVPVFREQTR